MAPKFPIPSYPPNLREVFLSFCEDLEEKQVQDIRLQILNRVKKFSNASEGFVTPNIELGKRIAAICLNLVDTYQSFSAKERELIAGGTLYFLAERDFTPDDTPITGYDDDARLLNHVLEEIGREELILQID